MYSFQTKKIFDGGGKIWFFRLVEAEMNVTKSGNNNIVIMQQAIFIEVR